VNLTDEELIKAIGKDYPCVCCKVAIDKMRGNGWGNLADALRCVAEVLVSDQEVPENARSEAFGQIGFLMQSFGQSQNPNYFAVKAILQVTRQNLKESPAVLSIWNEVEQLVRART